MTKPIDLIELRKQIKEGIFNVYLYRKRVYIEDVESGESVMIYDLKADWLVYLRTITTPKNVPFNPPNQSLSDFYAKVV